MFNFGEWNSCETTKPTKNGDYLVLGVFSHNDTTEVTYSSVLPYDTQYGWNANEKRPDTVIEFNAEEQGPSRYFWTEVTFNEP